MRTAQHTVRPACLKERHSTTISYLFDLSTSSCCFLALDRPVVASLCMLGVVFVVASAEDAPISLCSLFVLDRPVVALGSAPLLAFWATTGPVIIRPAPIRAAE